MGADYIYLSPCCVSENYHYMQDEQRYFCDICGHIFDKPIMEDVDYDDE